MTRSDFSALPATDRLYYSQSSLREFTAQVVFVREDGWVALDRSAFYPTSGGQPYDTGCLTGENGPVRVIQVEAEGDVVWHRTEGSLRAGETVRGTIDWERRFDHMQQHAADHMLAGVLWQRFGGVTIGLHLGKETSTIDLAMPEGRTRLTEGETDEIEALVNARVQQDDPIRCWFPSREELKTLPLRKQDAEHGHVRVVAMGDYEMVPCGGTHPGSTGRIGPIKILSTQPARGKMRVCFAAGMRAVRLFQSAQKCAEKVSALLSSDWMGASDALTRERESQAARNKELNRRLAASALETAKMKREGRVYAAHLPFADRETLVRTAAVLTGDENALVLLSCPAGEERAVVFARGAAAKEDMAALLRQSGARGGGRPDMAQGSAKDASSLEAARRILAAGAGKTLTE